MRTLTKTELREALAERKPDDHKGVFGHVLVVAGARGMAGAAILCARAALRSGAGLVTVASPAGVQSIIASSVPEAMTLGLPENAHGALRTDAIARLKPRKFDMMAIGPGLSTHPDTAKFVLLALSNLDVPAVVDADALNVLAHQEPQGVRDLMKKREHPCVFTPHPGEMGRCLRMDVRDVQNDRGGCAERLAQEWSGVALLKGKDSVISDGKHTVVNHTGTPGLAKGGTGDVLTGLIAGLWAQKAAVPDAGFHSAALGAWLHGKAGEAAEKDKTVFAMTAGDVIERLPDAFKQLD